MAGGTKFYKTLDFQLLNQQWRARLKAEKFPDVEDERENLKEPDRRSAAFENRDAISDYYSDLMEYLSTEPGIPAIHRLMLGLLCDGVRVKGKNGIAERTGYHSYSIYKIIRVHKRIVLARR